MWFGIAPRNPIKVGAKKYVLDACEVFVSGVFLGDYAHIPADFSRMFVEVEPCYLSLPASRPLKSCQYVDGRGLSCPVWPQEAEDLALLDFEAYSVDGLQLPKDLGQALD